MRVIAYLGLGSRYSYLAHTQLERIETVTGVEFEWVPVNSAELIRLSRSEGSPFDQSFLEGQYDPAFRDLDARRWAEHYGIPYHTPDISALSSNALALTCWCSPNRKKRRAIIAALFDAIFVKGLRMDLDNLCRIVADFGISRSDISDALNGGDAWVHHDNAIATALNQGVFGVPSFVVNNALFWGNDRLVLLEHHLCKIQGK